MNDLSRLEAMDKLEAEWLKIAPVYKTAREVLRESLDGKIRMGALATVQDVMVHSDTILDTYNQYRSELLEPPTEELPL